MSLLISSLNLRSLSAKSGAAMKFTRITVNPSQMGVVPCLRNLRIPVATFVSMFAEGMREDEILEAFPDLEAADIQQALRYAAVALQERELPLLER